MKIKLSHNKTGEKNLQLVSPISVIFSLLVFDILLLSHLNLLFISNALNSHNTLLLEL